MPSQAKTPSCNPWKRREFLRMAAGMALALLLPGCQQGSPSPRAPLPTGWTDTERYMRHPPWRIGRSGRGDINAWMVMLSAHIEYGITDKYRESFRDYFCSSANWDPNKQIEDIGILLKEGIDLLLIDPMDTRVVAAGVRQSTDAGVPVIVASTRVSGAPYTTWVALDDEERGSACADWLCRSVTAGRMVVVVSEPAAGESALWLQGVQRTLDTQPQVEMAVLRCPWSSAGARQALSPLLSESPAISGVIVQNGALAQGVFEAFADSGRPVPPLAGADDSNGWLRTAREHQVRFLGLSGGANLGLRAVDLATQVLSGERVPRYLPFPFQQFDDTVLDRYYRPELSEHYWAINDLPQVWIERMYRL